MLRCDPWAPGNTQALEECSKTAGPTEVIEATLELALLAAKSYHAKMATMLLERGAKVAAQTEMRQTPVDAAARTPVAEVLKKHGAKRGADLSL